MKVNKMDKYFLELQPVHSEFGIFRKPGVLMKQVENNIFQIDSKNLGRYQLVFTNLTWHPSSSPYMPPPEACTWNFKEIETGYRIYLLHSGIVGVSSQEGFAEKIEVKVLENNFLPGACKSCGSIDFTVNLLAEMQMHLDGEKNLKWEGDYKLKNSFAKVKCSHCNMPHNMVDFVGKLTYTINNQNPHNLTLSNKDED